MIQEPARRARPPRRRRGRLLRPLVAVIALLATLGIGIAIGAALHDNPKPGGTITYVRTIPPPNRSK